MSRKKPVKGRKAKKQEKKRKMKKEKKIVLDLD